jgi:hypothetical protein
VTSPAPVNNQEVWRLANSIQSPWFFQERHGIGRKKWDCVKISDCYSSLGPDRQPTTGTRFALARLTPACLLPTIVHFKKDPSFHYSWNLTDLLGQLLSAWVSASLTFPFPPSVGPTTTRGNHTRTNEISLSLFCWLLTNGGERNGIVSTGPSSGEKKPASLCLRA